MKKIIRLLTMVFAALLPITWAVPCFAEDSAFKEIFQDSLYGGLAGSLIGAAVMAFTKRPANHLEYLGYGAAGGVIAGAAIGAVRFSKSVAEVDPEGKVKFAIPIIIPDFREPNSKRQSAVVINTELLSGKF
ncbi:MAG TPA: hypothetical protein VMJ66_01585 [Geobacteraceae bacterium]|nr:hypothetical protein [Geobacteraceae bacterium]